MKNAKDSDTSLKTDDISTSLESRYTEVLVSGNNQELEAITASQEPQSTGVDKTFCDKINEKDSDSDIERRNIEDIDGIINVAWVYIFSMVYKCEM